MAVQTAKELLGSFTYRAMRRMQTFAVVEHLDFSRKAKEKKEKKARKDGNFS